MTRILVVDDDIMVARLVARVVEFCRHEAVVEMDSMHAVAAHIGDRRIGAVLADYMMPGFNGVEVLTAFMDARPEVRRVIITAAPHEEELLEAKRAGIVQLIIAKPPSVTDVEFALAWL